jgi:hypothetical protein
VKTTTWGAPLEPSSSEKAATYRNAVETFSADPTCVGGYAFKWGWKVQVTCTWICLLNEYEHTYKAHGGTLTGGEETAGVDEISRVWTGAHPRHRAPALDGLTLAGAVAADSVRLAAGATAEARCAAHHPGGGRLTYLFLVLPECGKAGDRARTEGQSWKGGVPPPVAGAVLSTDGAGGATIRAPDAPGAYRLHVWASDAHNKVATANIPFEVP